MVVIMAPLLTLAIVIQLNDLAKWFTEYFGLVK